MIQNKIKQKLSLDQNDELPAGGHFLKQIIDALSDNVLVIDSNFMIRDVNRKYLDEFNYKKEDIMNCQCFKINNKISNPCSESIDHCPLKEIFQSGTRAKFEQNYIDDSGIEYTRKFAAFPLKNNNGEVKFIIEMFHDVPNKNMVEESLKQSVLKYNILFNSIPEMIILVDLEGIIIDCNEITEKVLSISKPRMVGIPINKLGLFGTDDITKLIKFFTRSNKITLDNPIDMEVRFGNEQGWVEVYPALIKNKDQILGIQLILKNITELKRKEKEIKMRMLKFRIENGRSYLVKESQPTMAVEAFKDLLKVGNSGLVISRIPEDDFSKIVKVKNYQFLWLAEKGIRNSIQPKFNLLETKIERLLTENPGRMVALLNGLDYLIFKNGFKRTLSYIQNIKEITYLTNNISIFSIDVQTLEQRQVRMLELECVDLQLKFHVNKLSPDQVKMLNYIYKNNLTGNRPSYTELGSELLLSKPTIRKRIRLLARAGYIAESVRGRNKVLELSSRGKEIMT